MTVLQTNVQQPLDTADTAVATVPDNPTKTSHHEVSVTAGVPQLSVESGYGLTFLDPASIDLSISTNVRTDPFNEHEDEDGALVSSMGLTGNVQPALVQKVGDRYRLILGSRRYYAALASRKLLLCLVTEAILTDEKILEMQITENYFRKPVNRLDLAKALAILIRKFGSKKAVADRLGIAPARVSEHLLLLQATPEDQEKYQQGQMLFTEVVAQARTEKCGKGKHRKPRATTRSGHDDRSGTQDLRGKPEVNLPTPEQVLPEYGCKDADVGVEFIVAVTGDTRPPLDNVICALEKHLNYLRHMRAEQGHSASASSPSPTW